MKWIDADEATKRLKVSKATLYAYVSRGLVESRPLKDSRARLYSANDVSRLVQKKADRKNPSRVAKTALDWGVPVMDSAITLVTEGRYYYRGQDACELARTATVEQVARLLWTSTQDNTPFSFPTVETNRELDFSGQLLQLAVAMEAHDFEAWSMTADGVAGVAERIFPAFIAAAGPATAESAADRLAQAWGMSTDDAAILNAALILLADHELNVSAFAARCAASAGASPYGAISAGIAAARGRRHAGIIDRVDAFLGEIERRGFHDAWISRLRRGESTPGFGHPLYPAGDPRAKTLKAILKKKHPNHAYQKIFEDTYKPHAELEPAYPSVDFALAITGRVLGLKIDQTIGIFVLGRTIGWLAHIAEQYEDKKLIRPRANYVGAVPS